MPDVDLAEISKRATMLLSGCMYGPPELIATLLKPTAADYEAVFLPEGRQHAEALYAGFWTSPPAKLTRSVNAQVQLIARHSQDIVASNEFPGGYSKVAHLLAPDQVWCRFKLVGNGGADVIAYDGLVWRGDRFAWFPKPWRMLDLVGN